MAQNKQEQPQLRIEAGAHTALICRIATDAQGRLALSASDDKTARLWDVASGRLLHILRPPLGEGDEGKLYAAALSPDGRLAALAGWTKTGSRSGCTIYLFALQAGAGAAADAPYPAAAYRGQLCACLEDLPEVILHLAFSPDGAYLAACLGVRKGLRVFHFQHGKAKLFFADEAYGKDSYGATWHAKGLLATTCYDGKLRLYQMQAGRMQKLKECAAPGGKQPFGIAFAPDGDVLTVGYDGSCRVDVLDASSLQLRFSADVRGVENGNLSSVAWSGDWLLAGVRWDKDGKRILRRWAQGGRGQGQDIAVSDNTIMSLAPLPGGACLLGLADPAWGVLDAAGQWQARSLSPKADLRGSRGQAFLLNETGRQVQFGFAENGKDAHVFDLPQRKLRAGQLADGHPPLVKGLPIENWVNQYRPRLAGQALPLHDNESSRSLALAPDAQSFILGTEWSLYCFDAQGKRTWQQAVPGVVWGVNIARQGRLLLAAYDDGSLRWHRLRDGVELLAFFPHADRQRWVLWTPSGYYDASPGGEELIGWHLNQGGQQEAEFYPAARFRQEYYRPDVIDCILDTEDEAQALAQANAVRQAAQPKVQKSATAGQEWVDPASGTALQRIPKFSNEVAAPDIHTREMAAPVLQLLHPPQIDNQRRHLVLAVNSQQLHEPISEWRVRIDGRQTGFQLLDEALPHELLTALPARDCLLDVFARNRYGWSEPASLDIRWCGQVEEEAAPKPRLFMLAVGVSDYAYSAYNLGLAHKDAQDFANLFTLVKQGGMYRQIHPQVLLNQNATRENILEGMSWLRESVKENDVGMLFLAGHGVNDQDERYYFVPHDGLGAKLKSSCVVFEEIRNIALNLPGRAVLFLDTCHAGNVLGKRGESSANDLRPANIARVINELSSKEGGAVVFSACNRNESAQELADLKNGVFTHALVRGLEGEARRAGEKHITYTALHSFVAAEVSKLTKGVQNPVLQAPGGVPDFPLALLT